MGRRALAFALLLAGCAGGGDDDEPVRPAAPPRTAEAAADTRQCHADMKRDKIGFKALPDRRFSGGCSALGAVQLLEIGTPVTNLGAITCPMAHRFAWWVRGAVQPAAQAAFRRKVVKVESFGSYACRPVNGQAGNKLSEHGRANAVDIAAFVLEDGRRVTVLGGWRGEEDEQLFLRAVHKEGCRRFGVTLGPDSNGYHRNHFHFDMGRGPYCR